MNPLLSPLLMSIIKNRGLGGMKNLFTPGINPGANQQPEQSGFSFPSVPASHSSDPSVIEEYGNGQNPSPGFSFGNLFKPNNFGGLLNDGEADFAQGQGLLGAAGNMLAMSGPSTTPTSFGQAVGAGLQGFNQGRQGGIDQTFKMKSMQGHGDTEIIKNAKAAGIMPGTPEFTKFFNDHYVAKSRGEYFSPVQTAGGIMSFDHRTGSINPVGGKPGSTPVVGAANDPDLQRRLAESKKYGDVQGEVGASSNVKKPQQARETIALLDEADKLISSSTGSAVGAITDAAAGAFGIAPKGAQSAAKLKVLQAGLMTNMPRMEGPQSDADVKLYREAAGQIGDPTVPNEIKKSAVATIRTIQQRYADRGQPQGSSPSNQTQPKSEFSHLF